MFWIVLFTHTVWLTLAVGQMYTKEPIELKITIESQEELHDLLVFSSLSSNIRVMLSSTCLVLSSPCLDYDSATTLKRLLDNIGDCL